MIIFHLTDDNQTLKACAATCIIWRNVATPHLHRTLILWSKFFVPDGNGSARRNPLPSLHQLGLLPLVKELQFSGTFPVVHWVTPAIFNSRNMQFLRAMVNLRELRIADLDFSGFPTGLGECLGHFSPTVRSVALRRPNGTRRQLLEFFRLFPMLDDVEVLNYSVRWEGDEDLDGQLVPMNRGLRGQLTLHSFGEEGLFEDMVVAFGGIRFTSMDLRNVRGMQPLLEACAHTLETLRIYPDDISNRCKSASCDHFPGTSADALLQAHPQDLTLSCCTTLQSIEVPIQPLGDQTKRLLSTITSPAFSEIVIVFSERDVNRTLKALPRIMRELYEVKECRAAFCLESLEENRGAMLHTMTLETEAAVAAGLYDFLPCPPSVFSRTIARHDRRFTFYVL